MPVNGSENGVAYLEEKPENTSSMMLQCTRLAWMWALARSLRVGISYYDG